MSNVENISRVYLLNVPLEKDYKHTLYFDTKEAQETYFKSRIVARYDDFSYIKKENVLRIPKSDMNKLATNHDQLLNLGVNYVMYQNKNFSNKWFYCFIKDLHYINDERTDIEIETDVIQTWLFDYSVLDSFVEREHTSDDTIGLNTIPENLELGEFICNDFMNVNMGEPCIVVGTTQVGSEKKQGGVYAGVYSGVHYLVWKVSNYKGVNNFIKTMDEVGGASAIQCIFIAPNFIVDCDKNANGYEFVEGSINTLVEKDIEYEKNYDLLNNYAPKNKKLFTFPYNYLLVSNNNGASAVYRYENFNERGDNSLLFKMYGSVCPGCSIKLVPVNYKGVVENLDEGLNGGKFPICNWNSDVYTNWLTQNSVNITNSYISSGLQVVSGIGLMATPGGGLAGAGAVANGVMGISNTLAQKYQMSLTPPQAEGNINCGDVLQGMGKNTFTIKQMSVKEETAKIIDDYFTVYGYQTNRVKIPNKNHRKEWWYTKTIDVNITGAIPQNDMQIIKNCYNNGITFWKNPTHVELYSIDNSTI
jgi:hypothetical protein